MGSVAERVARGVALLDEKRPGWVDEIELSDLDISSADRCILGQLYGSYYAYDDMPDVLALAEDRRQNGFTLSLATLSADFAGREQEWSSLQAEWTRVITERRERR